LSLISEESTVAKFLSKNGEGVHHIAFKTDDVDAQLKQAEKCVAALSIKRLLMAQAESRLHFCIQNQHAGY
jgi:methylmalonyl-CoA/ethylmalonyl-CoA epimerase